MSPGAGIYTYLYLISAIKVMARIVRIIGGCQKIQMSMYEERLRIFDELVAKCPRFQRKGKTMPYTSANGYMFSLLNKAGEIGIRFSKEVQTKDLEAWDTTLFRSYNAVMHGYVLVPEHMLGDLDKLAGYLDESYDYVMGLPPN